MVLLVAAHNYESQTSLLLLVTLTNQRANDIREQHNNSKFILIPSQIQLLQNNNRLHVNVS